MRIHKQLSIAIIVMLFLSLATITFAQVNPQPAQAMWVDPALTDGLSFGDTFSVDIYINVSTAGMAPGALGLYAWEFKLFYESAYVNCTGYTDHLPYVNWNAPNHVAAGAGIEYGFNATHDRIHRAVSALPFVSPFPTPFVGVMSICTIDFKVVYPGGPTVVGDLAFTKNYPLEISMGDDTGAPFAFAIVDGSYRIPGAAIPEPTLEVQPSYVTGVLGQKFNLSINIVNLAGAWDLCGWEVKLAYNTTVLDALNSYEGGFLPSKAGVNGTYYLNIINDTLGVVHTSGLFLGNHTVPSGSGTLALIEFNATYEFLVPAEGSPPFVFDMDLYDTLLSNCTAQTISHTVNDGEYEAPYRTLGWDLDCYTWIYRKPLNVSGTLYETPNIGLGPNMTCDAFEPQELVVLYAELKYNEEPEQGKDVAFEIYGPQRAGSENITIFRVARTNAVGIATINFTIPWPCDDPEEVVIGKWYCFQKVQVKDPWDPPYYGTPNDTLRWDVGWYVELLDVTVDPDPVEKLSMLCMNVTYKVISQIPRWVVFTFTIMDDLLDPVGFTSTAVWVEPGVWCNPAEGWIEVCIEIPKWAHVGPRAMVYVNAFSGLPTTCGVPWCPEISTGFSIIAASP